MRAKIIKYSLLLFLPLLIGSGYFFWPDIIKADSSDAIAIRIVENPQHYSTLRWYQSQNFTGSPQSLQIDGYDAIRDNQTAYVNVANIVGGGSGSDSSTASLHTNIFIISYAQDTQGLTSDIFGQLIKNLKFNTNLSQPGTCSLSGEIECLSTSQCPAGEYCNSQKAKVIRDVKRLSDLQEIKAKLEEYKEKNNFYPRLSSGTYLPNRSVSTWPSWQNSLASALGSSLPVDPLNKLGSCPDFNPVTCWNEQSKSFATDLSNSIFPSGSHIYFYSGNDQGTIAKYCAQMETRYANTSVLNCFNDKQDNRQPAINAVSLIGQPRKEFVGYASISDPDGNPLTLSVDLLEPSPATWLTRKWRWANGLNKFQILPTFTAGQKKIYASSAGDISSEGYYKIRLSVDDGQGAVNSVYSNVYNITLNPLAAYLEKGAKTTVIGRSESVSISGADVNGDPITNLAFKSAFYENVSLTQAQLDDMGLWLRENGLLERFTPAQRTGTYTVNVSSVNPNTPEKVVDSSFSCVITNNPPIFNKLVYYFGNNTSETCSPPEKCTVSIDNGEKATVQLIGQDPDGHTISYSLLANPDNALAIDPVSGIISGFENLNSRSLSERVFTVTVKMSDQYCANSKENECSSIYSFNAIVKKYCSLDMQESVSRAEVPGTLTIHNSGEVLNTGLNLSDCSIIGSSTADVKFVGESRNQSIVLVSDISKSMDANMVINGVGDTALNRLKTAATGFVSQVYNLVKGWSTGSFVKISLVAYNRSVVSQTPLLNLISPGVVNYLTGTIYNYTTNYETHTLSALNEAEKILSSSEAINSEKIVILMSDGIPGIDGYEARDIGCIEQQCYCGGVYPDDCIEPEPCQIDGYRQGGCKANECYQPTCGYYGGTYPFCNWPPYDPPHSSYNNLLNIYKAIGRLFKVNQVEAITPQTRCIYSYDCDQRFPGVSCSSNEKHMCSIWSVTDCDLTADVDTQTRAMKNAGISIYTIYYNTSNTLEPKQRMCNWSSNNGVNCDNNTYAFSGSDISGMINNVLKRIVTKPKDVKVGDYSVVDANETQSTSQNNVTLQGLSCGEVKPTVTFSNNGYLEFSNLKLEYCPAKLHP